MLPGVGPYEMFLVCLIALLLFGNRLPEVLRALGQTVFDFKRRISSFAGDQLGESLTTFGGFLLLVIVVEPLLRYMVNR